MKTIDITDGELKELAHRICEVGEDMDIDPERFTIMLAMIARHLGEAQGIEVHSERVIHS